MKAGRELDAKVAEFMGWEIETHGCGPEPPYYYQKKTNRHGVHLTLPLFSTDISAAMHVLEKARKSFFSTTITMWDHTDKVVIVGDKRQGHNENISVLTVQAETFPLAICKFALRTKENKNE